jgi:hypothetical protein
MVWFDKQKVFPALFLKEEKIMHKLLNRLGK